MYASKASARTLATLLAVAAASGVGAAGAAQTAADTTTGSWHQHQVTVNFLPGIVTGTTYSCEGMIQDLTFLLKQSGARLNGQPQVFPCVGSGAGSFTTALNAKLDFSTFMPDSAGMPGSWRTVEFSAQRSAPTLHSGDCELVEEFTDQLMQYFTRRNVKYDLNCFDSPVQNPGYDLSFETFVPADTARPDAGGG